MELPIAAPAMPQRGKPASPKISIASKTTFSTPLATETHMMTDVRSVPLKKPLSADSMTKPTPPIINHRM